MSAAGLNAFVKQFFPQIRKEGMVIDVRYNGGEFVDQLVFERLRRIVSGMQSARNWQSTTIPDVGFHGYLACLANGYTASDRISSRTSSRSTNSVPWWENEPGAASAEFAGISHLWMGAT